MTGSRVLSAAVLCLCLSAFAAPAAARIIDGVVAVVNDEPITFSEFRESVAENLGIPEGDADIFLREERDRDRILRGIEALVESVLVHQELEKVGQSVTDKEIDRAVASVRQSNNMTEEEFLAALEREGVTRAAYRRRIRWQMERGAIVRVKKMKEVTVTEEETRAYFRENAERFLAGAEVRLETLFLPLPAGAEGSEDGSRLRISAQRAWEYVGSGMTLGEASRLLASEFPGVDVVASDFVKTDDLLPEIQREIRRLRTGETSPPFFTEGGAHLVRVLERRGGTLPDFGEVKAPLTEELVDRRSEQAMADILDELKKAATIDIRL